VRQIVATSRAIDNILKDLPSWKLQNDGFKLANRRLQVLGDALDGIRNILIVDAEGRVVSSSEAELIGRNVSQRDFFQTALKNPGVRGLYLAPPFKTSSDGYVMSLNRVIPGPRGEFAGIVVAGVDPEYFKSLLDSVRYSPAVRASVADGDGMPLMMVPAVEDMNGKNLATPGSLLARHRDSGLSGSVFSGISDMTGEERMIAFRTVQPADLFTGKPLAVAVSRNVQSIFAPWQRESRIAGGMFGLMTLAAILSLVFYQRRQRAFDRFVNNHELERQAAEARLRAIFDASPDPLLISTEQGVITMTNQQVEALLGYKVEELIGQSIECLVPERFRMAHPGLRAGFAASSVARRMMGHDLVVKAARKDGSECDVEISLSRIETPQGLFFASALRDVTERKQAEAELRIAAAAFESQEGMVITDANTVILRVNRAFTETTGYTAAEAVGQTPRLLKSGRHDADFYRTMWQTINLTGTWQGEIWDRRKNGQIYPKWLTITAVKSEAGSVTHYVGTHTDITARKLAEDEIKQLAFNDPLTQLPNRRLLLDRLGHALASSARSGRSGALLYIDLDNFKTLNDTLGHDIGDLLLQQVAQRLTTCVREGDTVARLGGDEFVVMLEDLSGNSEEAATQTEFVGEKILATLNQPYLLAGHDYRSTPSIGVTLFSGHQYSIEELLKHADLAMYKSKATGRNRVRFFDPSLEVTVNEHATLEKDLRRALAERQFLLHYQAQIVDEDYLTGAEVLVRWRHPERGMLSPAVFIPIAEETGLILPLGHWVLQTACAQLAIWATQPEMAHLTIAVNVSANQLHQNDFVEQVLAVIDDTGANPQRLKLELTESLLLSHVEEAIEKMLALKSRGVGFSLDDFGTGYSSLAYLKRLPLDQLKIDQSFIRDVLVDSNDAAIARTVIALAGSLGLDVIAEGVETETQRAFLARSGCHAYQGYLFSRPLPIDGFEEFARRV